MVTAHVLAVIVSIGAVLYADRQGSKWFFRKVDTLPKKTVDIMHTTVAVALAATLLTGGLMFIDRSSYLLANPAFQVKMVFVAALVINGFFNRKDR